jgi:SAM-dependent methyltransferase
VSGELHGDRRRAESFGDVAESYERERPSYPAALVDELMSGSPNHVLDAGCGTGKAGRLFVARGCAVLGVEIDPRMAAVARRHGLEVEVSAIEDWDPTGRRFDLLISGQAWHWVDPGRGAAVAAAALRPGARVALFWNHGSHDDRTQSTLDEVYGRLAPEIQENAVAPGSRLPERAALDAAAMAATGAFGPPESFVHEWFQDYPRERWVELIATHSDHHTLPDDRRAALLAAVGEAVDGLGGSVRLDYRTLLTCWRRLG